MGNEFKPAEQVLVYHDSSFYSLGMDFDPAADYAGCRLCGRVYQSELDRLTLLYIENGLLRLETSPLTNEPYYVGEEEYIQVYLEAFDRRQRWRKVHRKRYHSDNEVDSFTKTGFALTPEAAHALAPFGFAPTGNLGTDIMDAMATAPRAPLDDSEDQKLDDR